MLHYRKRDWLILLSMATALAMIFIDQSAISIALPSIQRTLDVSFTDIQWVMNAYALCLASTLVIGGRVGDRLSHRQTYLIGITGFMLASVFCGLSQNITQLVVGRALQGLSGALMLPAASVIVVSNFAEEERGRAMGFYVAIASVFLALGPFLGGFITQIFSWRWIFFINVPIGLLGALTARRVVAQDTKRDYVPITDYAGFFLLVATIATFVTGIIESSRFGIASPIILTLIGASILLGVAFIYVERRVANPVVNLSIFRNKTFSTCVMIMLQDQGVVVSITFWMITLQYAMGKSPAFSGLLLMTCTLPIIFMAPIAGYSRDKYGNRFTIRFGTVLMCLSSWWISWVSFQNFGVKWLIPGFFVFGAGAPFVLSTAMASALSSIPYASRGTASGIAAAGKQLGTALGLAVWGAIMGNFYFIFLARILQRDPLLSSLSVGNLNGLLAGAQTAKDTIAHLPPALIEDLMHQARYASRESFAICMVCVGAVAFVSFLLTWRLPRLTHNE